MRCNAPRKALHLLCRATIAGHEVGNGRHHCNHARPYHRPRQLHHRIDGRGEPEARKHPQRESPATTARDQPRSSWPLAHGRDCGLPLRISYNTREQQDGTRTVLDLDTPDYASCNHFPQLRRGCRRTRSPSSMRGLRNNDSRIEHPPHVSSPSLSLGERVRERPGESRAEAGERSVAFALGGCNPDRRNHGGAGSDV